MNHRDTCVDLLAGILGCRDDAEALFSLATHEVQATGFQAGWDAHRADAKRITDRNLQLWENSLLDYEASNGETEV